MGPGTVTHNKMNVFVMTVFEAPCVSELCDHDKAVAKRCYVDLALPGGGPRRTKRSRGQPSWSA